MTENSYRKAPDVVVRRTAGEVILVPVRGSLAELQQIFVLNPVGECIWNALDGEATGKSLIQAVVDRFEVDWNRASFDVNEFIQTLHALGLLEVN